MAVNTSPAQSPGTIDTPPSDGGSWSFLDPVGGTTSYPPSSVGLLHSPASQHSLASFGIVAHRNPRHRSQNPSMSSLGLRSSHESMTLPMAPTSSPVSVIPAAGSRQPQTPSTFAELARQHAQLQAHQQAPSFPHPFPGPMGSSTSGSVTGTVGGSMHSSLGGSLGGSGDFNALLADPALQDMLLADQRFQELVPGGTLRSQQALQTQQTQQAQQAQQAQQQQAQLAQQAQEAQQLASMFNAPDLLQASAANSPWATMSLTDVQDDHIFTMDGYSQAGVSSPNGSFASMSPGAGPAASPIVGSLSDEETNLALNAYVLQEQEQQLQQWQQLQQSQLDQLQHLPMNMAPSDLQQLQQLFQFEQQLQTQPHNEAFVPQQSASPPSSRSPQASVPISKSKASLARPAPYNLNKVRGSGIRVTKKKAQGSSSAADKGQLSTSAGSEDRFVVFTPKSINSQSGPGNRFAFEGLETTSATQKGRKGPLTEDAKLSALNVRRNGACVCCHSRKVACGNDLPCKNCLKLLRPGIPIDLVCWRFENFLGPLFPDFLRDHFHADAMSTFVSENVASFSIDGLEQPCTVRLSLGPAFRSFFEIRGAKLFTPTPMAEVLYHTALNTDDKGMHLRVMQTAPIGLDPETAAAAGQQEKIRKAFRAFTDSIVKEDTYVQQLTYNLHTDLPGKVLDLVRRLHLRTNTPVVKTALSIYSMNFMMTHHLGLTYDTVQHLAPLGLVPADASYVTARLLNRQIKAILDQFMKDEVDKLFKLFLSELKAKSRTAWATCVAAFLVFCLFMEETGVAIDYFAVSENEADLQFGRPRKEENERQTVVKLCRELENQPFRKFSYQFHKIYQTYQDVPGTNRAPGSAPTSAPTTAPQSTPLPASTPSPTSTPSSSDESSSKPRSGTARPRSGANAKAAFNPLTDDKLLFSESLDNDASAFVLGLRELIKPSSESRKELESLADHPMLDYVETHPYPRDVAGNYKGRLVAKFLLSFQDESYIFTPAP